MYPCRADNLSEETTRFLDENDIEVVVESIVSVVSGTLFEKSDDYGASLYFDGQTFQHSVDCECLACLYGSRSNSYSEGMNVPEDRTCHTCGMYESYQMRHTGSEFIETNEWPTRHLCLGCYDAEHLCQTCGQPKTWGVTCQCLAHLDVEGWFIDREGDPTYRDEYENEDLPENNTEKVKQVKESVKGMGSLVFDLQEKLTEGEYLQLMDHLQKITNGVNSL